MEHRYLPCPTTIPHISSLGTLPCKTSEKSASTHGSHGALNTISPRKLNRVSGFFRLQMYTNELDKADPKNAMEKTGAMLSRTIDA